jgi:hypothetical protein
MYQRQLITQNLTHIATRRQKFLRTAESVIIPCFVTVYTISVTHVTADPSHAPVSCARLLNDIRRPECL